MKKKKKKGKGSKKNRSNTSRETAVEFTFSKGWSLLFSVPFQRIDISETSTEISRDSIRETAMEISSA